MKVSRNVAERREKGTKDRSGVLKCWCAGMLECWCVSVLE